MKTQLKDLDKTNMMFKKQQKEEQKQPEEIKTKDAAKGSLANGGKKKSGKRDLLTFAPWQMAEPTKEILQDFTYSEY
ncbi:hypothetical protein WISP_104061 [Willisornis vidua]|uniref:Uncharacterized protein n=1 Tax=Willisornis vidua TaxID=1566151 RepID=A0ABQ9CXR8_9PASS|nr:hypothetical protein WISP_104061 [Willisornis vidua]